MSIPELETLNPETTVMGKKAVDLLEDLKTSISVLDFVPQAETFEILAHPQLYNKIAEPLLAELGLSNKRFSFIKVSGPMSAVIWSTGGPAWLIPINTLDDSQPTASGRRLIPGEITYIKTQNVIISPKLVLLVGQK